MGPGRVVQRPPAVARAAASLAYVLACLLLWCGGIVWGYVSSCESESTAPIAPPRVHPINRRTNRRVDCDACTTESIEAVGFVWEGPRPDFGSTHLVGTNVGEEAEEGASDLQVKSSQGRQLTTAR